jgi:hypothetical protein
MKVILIEHLERTSEKQIWKPKKIKCWGSPTERRTDLTPERGIGQELYAVIMTK